MNHSIACRDKWPLAVELFGQNPGDCNEKLDEVDYNQDGFINFRFAFDNLPSNTNINYQDEQIYREFVAMAFAFGTNEDNAPRGRQINCSQVCISTNIYAFKHKIVTITMKKYTVHGNGIL